MKDDVIVREWAVKAIARSGTVASTGPKRRNVICGKIWAIGLYECTKSFVKGVVKGHSSWCAAA